MAIYTAFVGCSKKNDPVAPVCYMDTYTYAEDNYSTVDTYTYTNNKITGGSRSYSTGGVTSYTYNYDAQGRIVSIASTSTRPGSPPSDNQTLTYDANGRVIQTLSSSEKMVYTYNSSGQMMKREYYTNGSSGFTLNYSWAYTYPSTNTKNYSTQMDYNGSNVLQATLTFVYDTKQNPDAVLVPGSPLTTTNNATQVTFQNPGSSTSVVTYTYTYNANGFPITVVEQNSGYIYTKAYSYTNCK